MDYLIPSRRNTGNFPVVVSPREFHGKAGEELLTIGIKLCENALSLLGGMCVTENRYCIHDPRSNWVMMVVKKPNISRALSASRKKIKTVDKTVNRAA
jgi:hypothetical protein